jgi:hypothetical protein
MNIRIIAALCIGAFINGTSGYGQAGRRDPPQSSSLSRRNRYRDLGNNFGRNRWNG